MKSSFWNNERLLKLVIFACFLVVAALAIVFKQQIAIENHLDKIEATQDHLEDSSDHNRERQRIVKAIACRIEFAVGLESSQSCLTSEILEHWNPETSVSAHFGPVDRG